jgi:uridine phosphorylase
MSSKHCYAEKRAERLAAALNNPTQTQQERDYEHWVAEIDAQLGEGVAFKIISLFEAWHMVDQ